MGFPTTIRTAGVAFLALALIAAASGEPGRDAEATRQDFDRTVAPLLSQRCLDCHSGARPKGGLDLSRRQTSLTGGKSGPALVPGKPADSLLWNFVEGDRMPPKKPLPESEKDILRAWIAAGAPWGTDPIDPFRLTTDKRAGYDWWALRAVRNHPTPAVRNSSWCRNWLDAFVLQRLEARGLVPSPEADRRTLIRRLSFDLLGLPPSPEGVADFLRDDSPDAYDKLVEQYLGSPQYGVRWARHWLDVVRFGESNGFEYDEFRPNAWPYRDWVVDAFNRDLPYDEFVRLQLAGDVLRPGDPEALAATGFLVAGSYDTAGQSQQSEAMKRVVRQDELEDVVGTVGQTFLGLTVNCARCHDHKFDPVRQAEYYRLTAALAGVRHGERDLPLPAGRLAEARRRLAEWTAEREALAGPVRAKVLEGRRDQPPPRPLASWDFREGLRDRLGPRHGSARGGARLSPEGLRLGGGGDYVATAPLTMDLGAKTLEAWVRLDNLDQRGGGVLSVQTLDGDTFDALVFGEQEPARWLAGSNFFARTRGFGGPAETEAARRPVHLALTYAGDGTVTAYRDGHLYGKPYKSSGIVTFKAGQSQVVFGLRHAPAGGNKMLAGLVQRANLYDRALGPAEVAAAAGAHSNYVSPEEVRQHLPEDQARRFVQLENQIRELEAALAAGRRKVYAVSPRQPEAARVLLRGNPAQPGEVVAAGGIRALAGVSPDFGLAPDAPEAERRVRLARWVTYPDNPLFARVMVNRLWHYHFGAGLVVTPNDFGFNGGRPSHPELLDRLAAELAGHGWSLKHLHRLIVTSATYRQASTGNEAAARVDAGNRLLWRKSPVRLEAEMVRDAALSVAGRLDLALGGPGYQEFKLTKAPGTNTFLYPAGDLGDPFLRRTLYRAGPRSGRDRLLDAFDCPDPSTTAPSRAVTTTPLQALTLLNHALVLRLADHFAARLRREAGSDVGGQVRRAYQLAYGRDPAPAELALAREVVSDHGLAVLARALFNSNEFLYVD